MQQAIQAATAAVQGLAGGDVATALAGGAAPYLATVIKQTVGDDNPVANLMAHAALNAALALAKGENAVAGAAGAAIGEATGMISQAYYGKPASELTESERQTVSALATLGAGLSGGLIGDSSADAVSAAQSGKTTVENNLMAGNEQSHAKFVQEHGKDVLSCSDNPTSSSCQRGEAVNKAIAGALATGGVASITAPAQAMWTLGAEVNTVAQYADDGTVNPVNSIVAGWTNVITIGNG